MSISGVAIAGVSVVLAVLVLIMLLCTFNVTSSSSPLPKYTDRSASPGLLGRMGLQRSHPHAMQKYMGNGGAGAVGAVIGPGKG
ncbi:hypothetical protein JAAARDRAFT_62288 [Jaapia argillacea MUCL 33604]|uniref:Uncharacterized protein n=1 Tax=Jaapia argillacea MUCL 33604 TaxID=933084 RepID=A0A067PD29_9AGAM|nr:hypothetical protein JAAARDRAFT_62288 [Jaapia argillacea MUCL 33604]